MAILEGGGVKDIIFPVRFLAETHKRKQNAIQLRKESRCTSLYKHVISINIMCLYRINFYICISISYYFLNL
jgi:hypothetical protein